jgi:hypothetical protein
LPTRSGGLLILALLINKNSAATVWVFARLHHAYGKGYHGSGSLFPFKRSFNFKAPHKPQEAVGIFGVCVWIMLMMGLWGLF